MKNECCEKCGAKVCPYCKKASCQEGAEECLQAKVERLEQKVKELEARPIITIGSPPVWPYPVYIPTYQPPAPIQIVPYNPYTITCGSSTDLSASIGGIWIQ